MSDTVPKHLRRAAAELDADGLYGPERSIEDDGTWCLTSASSAFLEAFLGEQGAWHTARALRVSVSDLRAVREQKPVSLAVAQRLHDRLSDLATRITREPR